MGVVVDGRAVDRTNLHRVWKVVLVGIAVIVAIACCFVPVIAVALGLFVVLLLCARLVYPRRDRYIPNLYARDIDTYDPEYRAFIRGTISNLRRHRIRSHTLLWEAAQLPAASIDNAQELLLDLGVWIGWSTRLISDVCGRTVYGFDTFSTPNTNIPNVEMKNTRSWQI